jgi:NAD(P)-dependent dehydrogenase (short-subunit alcohol dehydrogenase family)
MYAVTKSGVDALTEISAKEVASKGLRVNCLSPGGMVDTHLFGPNKMPEQLKQHGVLEVDVIVPAAVWLASDASEGVTGAFISAKDFNERGPDEIREAVAAQAEKARRGRPAH